MMYNVLTYEEIDRSQWEKLVRESETGTWFQTPNAYEFFAGQPELFAPFAIGMVSKSASDAGLMNEERLRGVCVGYVTQERSKLKQYLTRRAIIVGGPALADDATSEEVQFLMEAVRKELMNEPLHSMSRKHSLLNDGLIYIETRNFNSYEQWKDAFASVGFEYVPHLNFHVDTSSAEVVDANLGKSRKRDIKTTIREGVTILSVNEPLHSMSRADALNEPHYVLNDEEKERLVHEYYQILKNLYETKVKTPLFPESFFQTLAKHKDGRLLLTEYNGKIIGGTVCVALEGKCLYEWFVCGRDGEWKAIFPSCYATYAGIKYAAEHNMPRFDMMGAGKPDEAYGVRDFKAKFGGIEVEHGRFLSVTKPLLYRLGVIGVKMLKRLK